MEWQTFLDTLHRKVCKMKKKHLFLVLVLVYLKITFVALFWFFPN